MSNGLTWAEQTRAMLDHAKAQLAHGQEEVAYWTDFVHHLEKAMELHHRRQGIKVDGSQITFDPNALRQMSVVNALIKIAESNNGLLETRKAGRILLEAGVFQSQTDVRNNLYSTLSKDSRFKRVRAGVWQLLPKSQELKPAPKSRKAATQRQRSRSGVGEIVDKMVAANPAITINEMHNRLNASGFDFKGKNPWQAINMARNRLRKRATPVQQVQQPTPQTSLSPNPSSGLS